MLPGLACISGRQAIELGLWQLSYHPQFLEARQADELLQSMLERPDWTQPLVTIQGKQIPVPRLVAWDGDPGIRYGYSGLTHTTQGWHPSLAALRDTIHQRTGHRFNFVLLNLYRDGQDAMGWHRDNESGLGPNPLVASLSLGAERDFHLRADPKSDLYRLQLKHGSLLLMPGGVRHQLPRRAGVSTPRINLSFRQVRPNTNHNVNH